MTTPGSGAFARIRADVEDVVGGRLKSVDDDGRLGGVGRPVVGRVLSVVVEQLVQNDLAVTMSLGRRVPLQADARRAGAAGREVVRRTGWNCTHRRRSQHHVDVRTTRRTNHMAQTVQILYSEVQR